MEVAIAIIAILVLLGGVVAVAFAAERITARRQRADAAEQAQARRAARWEVAEISGQRSSRQMYAGTADRSTKVVIRRVAEDGTQLDCIEIAEIPDNAPDWDERVLQARSTAAARASLLNTEA